jgi:glutamate--cysteine ligase
LSTDVNDTTPIGSRDELVETIASGAKPKTRWRIGTEHEKLGFSVADLGPVSYEGPHGIQRLLECMAGLLGWKPAYDKGNIIALADPVSGGTISLEPGGQFELSGAPLVNLHQTAREIHAHLAQVREAAQPLGVGFLGIGLSPKWPLEETPRMPRTRHQIMARYMPKVGRRGLDMMFRTCTVQVNLDFGSEADMVRKMRVGLALQPVATALFANSPFIDGKPNGLLSNRAEIWKDVDPDRTGILPFVFDEGFGYEAYVDWALDVPLYFVKRGDIYHDVAGASFRDLMAGDLKALPGEKATMSDWYNHLTTLFPDVRLKTFIEMRGADGGPFRRLVALPALWTGLLYDQGALDAAWDMVRDWTPAEILSLRNEVPKSALKTRFRTETVLDVARRVVSLAGEGLRRRGFVAAGGGDEAVHLDPLREIIERGETRAEKLVREYETEWGGDINELFRRYAY